MHSLSARWHHSYFSYSCTSTVVVSLFQWRLPVVQSLLSFVLHRLYHQCWNTPLLIYCNFFLQNEWNKSPECKWISASEGAPPHRLCTTRGGALPPQQRPLLPLHTACPENQPSQSAGTPGGAPPNNNTQRSFSMDHQKVRIGLWEWGLK